MSYHHALFAHMHKQFGNRDFVLIFRHAPLISLLAVVWVTCLSGLSSFALVDLVDEGFYSTISRHMLDSGDWITPRVGTKAFLGKPPLFFWFQACFIKMWGPTVLAARLPSALAVAFTSLILWWWMKRRGDELTGWLAAISYSLSPLAMGLAHIAMTDALLTLWFTVTIIGAIDGYGGKRSGYLVMATGAGLATMTKGPIGFLLPGATLFIWLLWRRKLNELRKPIILGAAALFLALVLPWHLAIWHVNGDHFLREYFWQHHFQRAVRGAFGHARPFWFYVPVMICASFPFIVFFPQASYDQIKKVWGRASGSELSGMWVVWASFILIFFSVNVSKLPSYILPVLPAMAILIALRLSTLLTERRGLARTEVFLIGLFGAVIALTLLACGMLGLSWRGQPSPQPYSAKLLSGTIGWQSGPLTDARAWYRLSPFILLAREILVLGILLLLSTALIILWRRSIVRVFGTASAMCLCVAVIFAHFAMPAWSRFDIEPMWQLAESTRPSVEQGQPLVLYGIHPARTSVRYLLEHPDLVTETTDVPVLLQVVNQYPRGHILTKAGEELPAIEGSATIERVAGRWVLWRFER